MFSKISVRNIPQHVFNALEALAIRHDRSTEAEARHAIQTWVQPVLVQTERNVRRKEVAGRLCRLLEQASASASYRGWRPSHVAEGIGELKAEEVEDWFLGEKEPAFAQLKAIAELFGIEPIWLLHGDGHIYPVKSKRLPEDPAGAVDWLLNWDDTTDQSATDQVRYLHLVRNQSQEGELVIVKESVRSRFRIFPTPIHVSDFIGVGGESMLMYLFVTLELLYKRYTKRNVSLVFGYLLRPSDVTQLLNGNTNPTAILSDGARSTWWEDIWDREMAGKHEYWPGYRALCDQIERAICSRQHVSELRAKVRSGEIR